MSMLSFVLLCACGLAAAHANDGPFEKVRSEIRAVYDAYVTAIKENDVEGALDIYHPDMRVLANNEPILVGRDALRPELTWFPYVGEVNIESEELGPEDENAKFLYEITHVVVYSKQGKFLVDQRNLVIWEKTDDGYKVYIVMTNLDGHNKKE